MPSNVFERFRDYFQGIADAFNNIEEASRIFPNTTDAGTTREDVFLAFLRRHIPKRCGIIKGGFIFDSLGNESKQIDIIITNDATIQFQQFSDRQNGGKSFSIIEGCVCAISIKTNLEKNELLDSLDNLSSIPQMPKIDINPLLGKHWRVEDSPICVIFAFFGAELNTILKHLNEYYNTNKVPDNRKPDFIIVNNKFIIRRAGRESLPKYDGTQIPPNTFYPLPTFKYVGGYSLWFLLTDIGALAGFTPHMLLNFDPYTVKMIDTFGLPK